MDYVLSIVFVIRIFSVVYQANNDDTCNMIFVEIKMKKEWRITHTHTKLKMWFHSDDMYKVNGK